MVLENWVKLAVEKILYEDGLLNKQYDGDVGGQIDYAVSGGIADKITDDAPAAADSTGIKGQIKFDSDYIYICINTNSWKRISYPGW